MAPCLVMHTCTYIYNVVRTKDSALIKEVFTFHRFVAMERFHYIVDIKWKHTCACTRTCTCAQARIDTELKIPSMPGGRHRLGAAAHSLVLYMYNNMYMYFYMYVLVHACTCKLPEKSGERDSAWGTGGGAGSPYATTL